MLQSRGQGSQFSQVLYIMKNYLAKNTEQPESTDAVVEFEGNYLTENLDKVYYINFNHGLYSARD